MSREAHESSKRIPKGPVCPDDMPIDLHNLMSLCDFAKKLGMSPGAVRTKKSRGVFPRWIFVKIGGNVYVDTQRFNRWINWKEKNRENQRQRAIERVRKSLG